jgi:hypothetical protein
LLCGAFLDFPSAVIVLAAAIIADHAQDSSFGIGDNHGVAANRFALTAQILQRITGSKPVRLVPNHLFPSASRSNQNSTVWTLPRTAWVAKVPHRITTGAGAPLQNSKSAAEFEF